MKTRIEWRHGDRVLQLDDTDWSQFPREGDIVEQEERGTTYRFKVARIESVVVVLELATDADPVTIRDGEGNDITPKSRVNRDKPVVAKRLSAERTVEKSQPLSKTARGNQPHKVVSAKKK